MHVWVKREVKRKNKNWKGGILGLKKLSQPEHVVRKFKKSILKQSAILIFLIVFNLCYHFLLFCIGWPNEKKSLKNA